MTVVKEALIPRVLSVQLALGTNHRNGQRDLAGQFAYAVLNLRHISTALVHTVSIKDISRISPEAMHSLRPLVRWSFDLIINIIDTLHTIKRTLSKNPSKPTLQALNEYLSQNPTISLHLLLSSFSRTLLRFQISWITKYTQIACSLAPRCQSLPERQSLTAISEDITSLPFKIHHIEILLGEFDTSIRKTYMNLSADRRSEIEVSMIAESALPLELESPLSDLMQTTLPKLCDQPSTDLTRLYFWDTENFLRLGNSREGSSRWDVIRKVRLGKGVKVRVCRRCGEVMEDVAFERAGIREMVVWLGHAQKHCICMNYWILP